MSLQYNQYFTLPVSSGAGCRVTEAGAYVGNYKQRQHEWVTGYFCSEKRKTWFERLHREPGRREHQNNVTSQTGRKWTWIGYREHQIAELNREGVWPNPGVRKAEDKTSIFNRRQRWVKMLGLQVKCWKTGWVRRVADQSMVVETRPVKLSRLIDWTGDAVKYPFYYLWTYFC